MGLPNVIIFNRLNDKMIDKKLIKNKNPKVLKDNSNQNIAFLKKYRQQFGNQTACFGFYIELLNISSKIFGRLTMRLNILDWLLIVGLMLFL